MCFPARLVSYQSKKGQNDIDDDNKADNVDDGAHKLSFQIDVGWAPSTKRFSVSPRPTRAVSVVMLTQHNPTIILDSMSCNFCYI